MDDNQIKRIETFLKSQGLDSGSVPKQRIKQLQQIDEAVQKRLTAILEAQQIIKDNSISIASIANDSGITRKTFYNNQILKLYVENYTTVNGEPSKLVKASDINSMKKRLEEQADCIAMMIARDIDIESIRHELDELRKVIDDKDKQIRNLTEMYESTLAELHEERSKKHKSHIISFENKKG